MVDVRVAWSRADAPVSAEQLLTRDEAARLGALQRAEDQARFRSAHLLVRLVVAQDKGVDPAAVRVEQRCARCGGPHGRPLVAVAGRPGPNVSLAHAGDVVVVATCSVEVGVDVEPLGQGTRSVHDVALSLAKQQHVSGLPPGEHADAVTRLWVRKEAVLKAVGTGLDVDPRQVEVTPPAEAPRLVGWGAPGRRPSVQLVDVDLDACHAAAVAALGRSRPRVTIERVRLSAVRW